MIKALARLQSLATPAGFNLWPQEKRAQYLKNHPGATRPKGGGKQSPTTPAKITKPKPSVKPEVRTKMSPQEIKKALDDKNKRLDEGLQALKMQLRRKK